MASRIQGITVEIGGDTTKLSKALESVNKSIKGTQSGLKDVNKLLKLDPSNTELVVQKQKMLKDAIEATKEKLATLKTAAQQANEQLANGEITQQQYDALQREIVETEQNLRSLQDQAATTNATLAKIDEAGEKLQNIGSSVENVGKKFLPVTAAVTGLGTAAVKTAADFDSEMSKVSAISGATGDDFDQLRAKAREMGAKTKFSASEAASAMEYMAMAGWKTSDMLNGIEGVMNLAAASGEDLATTSDIVTDALTAFGLSAADSGHFADKLYVEMDYCNDQLMHYYVVGSKLVNLGSIASTDGKPKRITLEIPSKKLEDAGYKDDYIQIVFTKNSTYDMTMSNVKAHYFNVKGSYFGEDYSLLHEQADTNTKELAALSEKVSVNADAIKTADANMQNLSKTISSVSTDMQVVMKQKSAFTGKKILFLGDSITALNTSERGWVRYFNEIIQPERFVNLSVSSARWCDYEDSVYDGNPVFSGPDQNHNNVMGNQVEKLIRGKDKTSPHYKEVTAYADFDMILIACGTNDGVPSGDMEGSFTSENEMVAIEELDRRAFASAFRYSIEKLQQLYPAAKIYICTPIQGYITTRSYAQSKAKGDYLKLLAGRMSLEVIDTFCCGICDIYEKKNANGRYLIDGLHPNAAGAKKIGVFNASAVIASYR